MKLNINLAEWGRPLIFVAVLIGAVLLAFLLTRLNKYLFQRIQRKQKNLQLSFFQHIANILIVIGILILTFSAFDGTKSVWQTLLGGTAIVSAVLAFAAQDVIKDILAGLMLSLNRPFEIGNRIELEDGTAGIVEEMTMRHVVILESDTIRRVLPNSRINAMLLRNYSYHAGQRSALFRFSVGYGSDLELAKQVIYDAIVDCPVTVPERRDDGTERYHEVLFRSFADSALVLTVAVYYEPTTRTEVMFDAVNTDVRQALLEHGIEIPYNYVSVVYPDAEQKR